MFNTKYMNNMDSNGMNEENPCCMPIPDNMCPPVTECPQEKCCHRVINHTVPHIIPINTRVINHHVYNHTYTPVYTCCEENVISNNYERGCR